MNTIIEKIRAEIERLMKENSSSSGLEGGVLGLTYEDGINTALNNVLDILDTLKEQPVCGFEPKFNVGDRIQFKGFGHNKYTIAKVNADDNRYVDTSGNGMDMSYTDANFELVKEEPVCEGLEEEITDFIANHYDIDDYEVLTHSGYSEHLKTSDVEEIARHFAKWQKEQDDKELSEKIASAYQLGLADKEKMMMKEAIDAEFCSAGMFMPMIDFKDKRMEGIKYGDTIKVIVIKEK